MLKFPEVALDGFGFLTSNTFRINHKKAYLFNFRVREIFTRLYCGRHTQGIMLIDVANERSCKKVFKTVIILNLSFETKKLWIKI